jgi:hypothetical protein
MMLITLTPLLLAAVMFATPVPPKAGGEPFALLELFTSEGCSSCPPADELLSRIATDARAGGKRVLTLELHVDYWNSLGWKDPFSSAEFSRRQQRYATAFGLNQIYTPQLVVNGTEQFVGSDQHRARAAIDAALARPAGVSLQFGVTPGGSVVRVDWELAAARPGALLCLALVDSSDVTDVGAGENAGNTLTHTHVVRTFATVPLTDQRRGSVSLARPAGALKTPAHVIGFVQDRRTLAILGAAER